MRGLKATLRMPIVLPAVVLSELSMLGSPTGLAQEIQAPVSRQEWQARVEDARRRSEEFVARARFWNFGASPGYPGRH
jgi:hypothetical protein